MSNNQVEHFFPSENNWIEKLSVESSLKKTTNHNNHGFEKPTYLLLGNFMKFWLPMIGIHLNLSQNVSYYIFKMCIVK